MGFERADRLGVGSISGNMSIFCGILPHSLMGILAAFPSNHSAEFVSSNEFNMLQIHTAFGHSLAHYRGVAGSSWECWFIHNEQDSGSR
jgi:hypothetical protein